MCVVKSPRFSKRYNVKASVPLQSHSRFENFKINFYRRYQFMRSTASVSFVIAKIAFICFYHPNNIDIYSRQCERVCERWGGRSFAAVKSELKVASQVQNHALALCLQQLFTKQFTDILINHAILCRTYHER